MLLKEEPEDGPRSIQKVPSLSDLSGEESIGEYNFLLNFISSSYYIMKISEIASINDP